MILTLDIGTTHLKAALFQDDGMLASINQVALLPNTASDGSFELDVLQWSSGLADLCAGLTIPATLKAVVVSGNGPTLVPVLGRPRNLNGRLVASAGNARLWLDRRAVREAGEISHLCGSFVDAGFFLPKALYLYRHQRPLYDQTLYFLSSYDYLNYLLTSEARAIMHAEGSERWYWSDSLLDRLGLDKEKFPPFCYPGDLIGTVTVLASGCLGIPAGIPVFAGGPDFFVSILGTGAVELGRVCDRSGTSEGINLCVREPLADDRLMTYRHPIKPFYNVSGIISTSGKAIGWAKDLFGMAQISFERMYAEMAKAAPGCGGLVFLPYLTGERAPLWDPEARGVFNGLDLSTGRSEMLRSVAEGVCFAIRDVITVMEELGGHVGELRITGGPAQSRFLNQLKADITGRGILVPAMQEAELLGSLVLAQTALGEYASLAEAAEHLVRIKDHYLPDPHLKELYDGLFDIYRSTYRQLKTVHQHGKGVAET